VAIQGIFYVTAAVTNLARAKKFYAETLGWKLNTDESYVGGLAFGSGYLIIHEGGGPPGGSTYVTVRVDDVAAEREQLRARGLAVSELKDEHWGERNFRFSDPDGNVWVYAQHIGG
jgi:catechol 2,3-dioxygenase-like lactoylglutathione lyase family enzyme